MESSFESIKYFSIAIVLGIFFKIYQNEFLTLWNSSIVVRETFYILFETIIFSFLIIFTKQYISGRKKKKILNKLIPKIAKEYIRDKYGEGLNFCIYNVELNHFQDLSINDYINSVYLYLDENKEKFIYLSLKDKDFKLLKIYDNLQDKTM